MTRASLALALAALAGCAGDAEPTAEVVVYVALDRQFAEPILEDFRRQTGIAVRAKYDTESTKSVGLAQQLLREAGRPRADVFWNNEILNTLRLQRAGALAAYASPVGRQYPAEYRDAGDRWFGFAARLRVLVVPEGAEAPADWAALTRPPWRGLALAKPLFGTTATHVACLWGTLGAEATKDWLRGLKANDVQILAGNRQVAAQVGAGVVPLGLTDTDDVFGEQAAGGPVTQVVPDRHGDLEGVLLIPNTVALIAGGPNPDAGRKLLDHLLSPVVERRLAEGAGRQIPLHPDNADAWPLPVPRPEKWLPIDYPAALAAWDEAMAFVKDEFTAP